jgi:hypothetical protein
VKLAQLVAEARVLAGDMSADLCATLGHAWQSVGGRGCPHELEAPCSQTAYQCERCDDWDYGERGGPADDECENHCPFEYMKKA